MTKQRNIKNLFIIAVFILASVFFVFNQQVLATEKEDVMGWAWSENIGWISFNCKNPIKDFPNGTCVKEDDIKYGVKIDKDTGEFSGYAWSENVGWINFGPFSSFPAPPNNQAKLNIKETCGEKEVVTGWAQVESTGGWIKMNGANYWVERDNKAKEDNATKDLIGWAWSEDFGWISFNCKNEGSCTNANYKVSTFTSTYEPGVTFLDKKPISQDYYCSKYKEHPQVKLNWTFKGCQQNDKQTGYQIQIDDDLNFDPPIIDETKVTSNEFYLTPSEGDDALEYGKTYYWRVSVQSNNTEWSKWYKPDELKDYSFSTPKHPYPEVSLKCSKDNQNYVPCKELSVSAGETIYFKGNDSEPCGGFTAEQLPICSGVSIKERTWGFGSSCVNNGDCLSGETCNNDNKVCEKTITGINAKTNWITRTYSAGTSKDLSLEITDNTGNDGYSCNVTGEFKGNKINFPLPIWKEVIPKD